MVLRNGRTALAALMIASATAIAPLAMQRAAAARDEPARSHETGVSAKPSIAVLGARMINDNENLEPTTNEERARTASLVRQLNEKLQQSGCYAVLEPTPQIEAEIAKGQSLGACGGCEIDYGSSLGAKFVAWAVVQKVSNLILNLNVYIADVETKKLVFLHSVDMRGNTNEGWTRAMSYLIDNYLVARSAS